LRVVPALPARLFLLPPAPDQGPAQASQVGSRPAGPVSMLRIAKGTLIRPV